MGEQCLLKWVNEIRSKELHIRENELKNFQLPLFERIVKKLAIAIYYVFSFDPLAIYKGTHGQLGRSKYQIYLRPELRMRLDNWDKRHVIIRRSSLALYYVISLRLVMVCFVQLVKYQATTYLKPYKHNSTILAPIVAETSSMRLLKQFYFDRLFDNILADFPGVALGVYLVVLAALTYMIFYMPYHYAKKPMDAVNFRILLNWLHEQKRVDLLLKETLDTFMIRIESHQNLVRQAYIGHLDNPIGIRKWDLSRPAEIEQSKEQVSHRRRSIALGEDLIRSKLDTSLRPVNYTLDYYRLTWHVSTAVTLVVVSTVLAFGATIQLYTVRWTYDLKCQFKRAFPCSIEIVFTTYDLYTIVEMSFIMLWFGVVLCLSIIMTLVHLLAQTILVVEMKSDLNNLLDSLRSTNMAQFDEFKNQSQSNRRGITHKIPPSVREPYLNEILLNMLVKIRVSLMEYSSQAKYISEEVTSFLFFFGTALVLAIVVGQMDGPDLTALRQTTLTFVWVGSNMILIVCASQYARISRLQTIGWSIVAQLNLRLMRNYHSDRHDQLCLDPLTISWQRLIEGGHLARKQNCVRPFGISITYQQILQLNYYVISLAVLASGRY